jgi:hypothetical protein
MNDIVVTVAVAIPGIEPATPLAKAGARTEMTRFLCRTGVYIHISEPAALPFQEGLMFLSSGACRI